MYILLSTYIYIVLGMRSPSRWLAERGVKQIRLTAVYPHVHTSTYTTIYIYIYCGFHISEDTRAYYTSVRRDKHSMPKSRQQNGISSLRRGKTTEPFHSPGGRSVKQRMSSASRRGQKIRQKIPWKNNKPRHPPPTVRTTTYTGVHKCITHTHNLYTYINRFDRARTRLWRINTLNEPQYRNYWISNVFFPRLGTR